MASSCYGKKKYDDIIIISSNKNEKLYSKLSLIKQQQQQLYNVNVESQGVSKLASNCSALNQKKSPNNYLVPLESNDKSCTAGQNFKQELMPMSTRQEQYKYTYENDKSIRIVKLLSLQEFNKTKYYIERRRRRRREFREEEYFLPILSRFKIRFSLFSLILLFLLLQDVNLLAKCQSAAESPQAASSTTTSNSFNDDSSSSSTSSTGTCFGGLQTFEKISMSSFENPTGSGSLAANKNGSGGSFGSGILIQQDDQALTSECVNLCRSQSNCLSFVIDYNKFECKSYATTQQELQQEFDLKFQALRSVNNNSTTINNNNNNSSQDRVLDGTAASYGQASTINFQHLLPSASSNYFEKICLDGVANRNQFSDVCGQGRLWTIERVVDSFLDGYVEKEVTNVNNKDECSKLCIFETQFVCRSADYDQQARLCRLSKEDRRTQPQAMRHLAGSNRQYIENQCATPGPSSCVYETKKNLGIISMDALKFAQTVHDCQMKCNQELTFNCRSYSFHQQRCFLSGDDSSSFNSNLIKLPIKQGWQFGEKKCLVELCTKGIFSYEKITGYTLRSALSTPIDLMMAGSGVSRTQTTIGNNQNAIDLNMMMMMGSSNLDELAQEASQERFRHLLPNNQVNFGMNNNSIRGAPMTSKADIVTAMMMAVESKSEKNQPQDLIESQSMSRYTNQERDNTNYNNNHYQGRRSVSNNNLAITNHCRHSCDLGYLNCPAFTIDYKNNRCQKLDRNSQGRHNELVASDGFSYYEKICLRVPEIMTMCQDKYWIFERVIGYELAPRFYDKSLKFVQSRRDCEEYCLEEKQFQCRSAMYNDETSDCKLSRYDRRLAAQEGGYNRNFNSRISYLENQCIRDHQINAEKPNQSQQQLSCYYEQARDDPSYPTFTEHIEMVPHDQNNNNNNNNGGERESTPVKPDSMALLEGNKTTSSIKFGASYCEQICNENSKFECHSFGYYSSTAQCFLSGDDSISAGDLAATPSTGFTYFEKKCRFGKTPEQQYNNNNNNNNINNSTLGETNQNQNNNLNPYFQPPMRTTGNNNTTVLDSSDNNNNFKPNNNIEPTKDIINLANTNETIANANKYKCGIGHSFVYQRISGFEPIGGYLTLLVKNNDSPGIVSECADLCLRAFECRAFVVDYNSNQCFAMLENSSIGMLSLRQTLGKDYFEGFCVPDFILTSGGTSSNCREKIWTIDKIVDQAVVGVQAQKILMDLDRAQCRQACLEERLFWCKSAMFDSTNGDCKLYSIDRESMPQMRLFFTKGVDFFENQCQIVTNSCPYDAIERDMTIVSVTKSLQARLTFDCEFACNNERSFNCRSYTYIEQYPSLPNLCLLSSDSRSTSQKGSVRERSRTLYAERNCYYRRPRYPLSSMLDTTNIPNPTSTLGYGSSIEIDPYNNNNNNNNNNRLNSGYSSGSQQRPALSHHSGHSTLDSYAPPAPPAPPSPPIPAQLPSFPARNSPMGAGITIGEPPSSVMQLQPPLNEANELPPGQGPCEPHQFTFERTFGYDYRLGQKERAPIAPTIGIAIGCQQECLRRSDRCQSFVVEYGLPYQSCFLIDTQVGANKKLLVKSASSAYFEKVCLPRLGIDSSMVSNNNNNNNLAEQQQAGNNYYQPQPSLSGGSKHSMSGAGAGGIDLQSMDISPSYSSEPWSPQLSPPAMQSLQASMNGSQLPYYLQQQQLVKNYPSRTCAKLWAFERFINHNLTIQSDKIFDNVLTRAQCETFCLNEASFNCRSATYDYTQKLCRLFKNTRRTIMSQFVDLDSPSQTTIRQQPGASIETGQTVTGSGSAQVISNSGETESIHASSSSTSNSIAMDNSSTDSRFFRGQHLARQMSPTSSTAATESALLLASKNIDYLENTCTMEPSSCQYRQLYDLLNPYIDKIQHAVSLSDCQRQCDLERLFTCKSINYEPSSRSCMLINEDLVSLNRGQQQTSPLLMPKKNIIYSEKSNCEMISVQCNSQEMLVLINFDSPFRGRIMAKGNPEQCYLIGDGQNNLQFPIVFGPKCNSRQEGHNTFVNEVVIQQHPVIMTDSDKTIRVMCAFEAPDQTITLKNPNSRDNKTAGIDVGTPDTSRIRHDNKQQFFNSVVSNKAAPPSVLLRIMDLNGRDATMINLGDDLVLKIQMQMDGQQTSALGIFARNLAARSSNGESLLLIDNDGCPVDHQVFPALEIDSKDGKSLYSNFKAFRFPSSGLVNFEVQIRFCPERCQPVDCTMKGGSGGSSLIVGQQTMNKMRSFGKRKKRQALQGSELKQTYSHRTSILESVNRVKLAGVQDGPVVSSIKQQYLNNPLDSLSTIMKPGKGFDYVRELMLGPAPAPAPTSTTTTINPMERDSSFELGEKQHSNNNNNNVNNNNNNNDDFIMPATSAGTPLADNEDVSATTSTTTISPIITTPMTKTEETGSIQKDGDDDDSNIMSSTVTEINQDFESPSGKENGDRSNLPQNTILTSELINMAGENGPSQNQNEKNELNLRNQNNLMVDSLQSPPILMHVDEKVLNQYASYLKNRGASTSGQNYLINQNIGYQHNVASAPYGAGFPLLTNSIDDQRKQSIATATTTIKTPQTLSTSASNNNNINDTPSTQANFNLDLENNRSNEPTTAGQAQQKQSNEQSDMKPIRNETTNTSKDLPLKFSILVGESQASHELPATISGASPELQADTSSSSNWIPNNPTQLQATKLPAIINPSNSNSNSNSNNKIDQIDHIVVPGRDGQLEETPMDMNNNSQAGQNNNVNDNNSIENQPTSNGSLESSLVALERHKTRNALYEQTFDALPSNSIAAEVKLNNKNNQQSLFSGSESAASHRDGIGCNGDSSAVVGYSLWTFIWTGTFVIVLNICLVVLSLILYFKRVHFKRYNHNIMRANSESLGNLGINNINNSNNNNRPSFKRARASRWPSVLLKSKNNLGTSINTHEHFFCKLNSKQNTNDNNNNSSNNIGSSSSTASVLLGGPNVGDLTYNWPNLSTSSSHSTLSSSMASPLPTTASTSIVRINNQTRNHHQLYKQTFSDSASIRNGNFNTSIYKLDGKSNHMLDLNNSYDDVNHGNYIKTNDNSH